MNRDEILLTDAVNAMRATKPDNEQVNASATRVAHRLGIEGVDAMQLGTIDGCDDVRRLRDAFHAKTVSAAQAEFIAAHVKECGACRSYLHSNQAAPVVRWFSPQPVQRAMWQPRRLSWALAMSLMLLISGFVVYRLYWQVPPGVRAEVQSIDGSAYLISDAGSRPIVAGASISDGDRLKIGAGGHAMLRLADGSKVEINQRSVVGVSARGQSETVGLEDGSIIVQAARRTVGHLYVKTPDCRVAVVGTVFSVDAGIKGSRVAVLQGTVHVMHAGTDTVMQAGQQVSTSDNLSAEPIDRQVDWSKDRAQYVALLAQLQVLQRRVEQIPMPQLRYSSDLMARMPADTLLYVSIPNLGDFLSQAKGIFEDQLQQSPVLQQWWSRDHGDNTANLDAVVDKLHTMSQYLGEEALIVGFPQKDGQGFAVVADLKQGGFDDFLRQQFPAGAHGGLTVMNEDALRTASGDAKAPGQGYALVRAHEVVFSGSIANLKKIDAQLNAGASGFASTGFGQQITSAYTRGAGMIVAADLHQMMAAKAGARMMASNGATASSTGIAQVRYLIAEHREVDGEPENRVRLQFAGKREGIASWLAAPAPLGSLQFVTPNASVVAAMLSKDPKGIADDMIAMAAHNSHAQQDISAAEAQMRIDFRADIAACLGGDFLVTLDGPVLPTPSWKAVIEVHDSERLQQTLERLAAFVQSHAQGPNAHAIAIDSEQANGQRYYSIHDRTTDTVYAQYTYSNGYLIMAPDRALLAEAIQTHDRGNSLAQSSAFKALLPKDQNENYSAIVYQNLGPVVGPLLSQVSGPSAAALQKLASDGRPTVICARGEESSLEADSDSHLFGFDFLALQSLLHSGNNKNPLSVSE